LILYIRPPVVAALLSVWVIALSLASLAGQLAWIWMGDQAPLRWVRAFNVDGERNIPTWYSSMALLLASGLLALCAAAAHLSRAGYVVHWLALSGIFVVLSLDELLQFHEQLRSPRVAALLPEVFARSWLPAGISLSAAVGLVFLRFLLRLPRRTARLFAAAGTVYVAVGAVGMEAVAWVMGYHTDRASRDLTYVLLATGEELAEMLGVVLFVYATLDHLARTTPNLRLVVGQPEARG
jgi:hypothetical protein